VASSRDRVRIRPLRRDDEAEFLERVRASRRLHGTWSSLPDTPERFAELLVGASAPAEAVYLIVRTEDDAIAGIARLSQIFLGNFRSAYLGYSAFVPYDGRGYMTQGLRLVLREAFGPIGLHRVEANVQPDNDRSIALVERLGFRREGFSPRYLKIAGRWRDHVRYALLAEDAPAALSSTRRSPRPPTPTGRTPPRTGRGRDAPGRSRPRP
jgi:ribosomal-protein-alanine N-acetyltransferase